MPTYEYECTECGHKFEAFQKITDVPLKSCPKCKKKIRRLISSGAGFIFKGSGFYATDYRKKPKGEEKKAPAEKCPMAKEGCKGCDKDKAL
ncbi:FmdB family zinc ribbon protein [Candidatus Omnitrophota bacterium]